MNESQLYNNCVNFEEPDWSQYTHLELGGSVDVDGETTVDVPASEAQFFTIYGFMNDGTGDADPITDCPTALEALAVAAYLTTRSGLVVQVHHSLEDDQPIPRRQEFAS